MKLHMLYFRGLRGETINLYLETEKAMILGATADMLWAYQFSLLKNKNLSLLKRFTRRYEFKEVQDSDLEQAINKWLEEKSSFRSESLKAGMKEKIMNYARDIFSDKRRIPLR